MQLLPLASLTLAMSLWASAFIALKHILAIWGPGQVIFGRMLVASCCFLLMYKGLGKFRYQAGDWRWLLLMTLAEPCFYFLLEANALRFTTAGQAGMITSTLPLLVGLVAYFMLGERVAARQWLGFLLAMVGVTVLSLSGTQSDNASNPLLGNLLEFGAMLCAAVYSVVLKKMSSRYSPLTLTSLQAFTGTLFFLPLALSEPWPQQVGAMELGIIFYLGTCITLGAYLLFNWAITKMPVTIANAYINLIPVFTLLFAYLLLGETLNSTQLMASSLVLVGVVLSQLPLRRRGAVPALD
ncbi:MAG: DMT family transporter [Aeromonadaceae bacterium]|nr:DMT family transporter [Aeromonadaceae bacterium]